MLAVVALRLLAIALDLGSLTITNQTGSAYCPRTFRLLQLSHTRFLGPGLMLAGKGRNVERGMPSACTTREGSSLVPMTQGRSPGEGPIWVRRLQASSERTTRKKRRAAEKRQIPADSAGSPEPVEPDEDGLAWDSAEAEPFSR